MLWWYAVNIVEEKLSKQEETWWCQILREFFDSKISMWRLLCKRIHDVDVTLGHIQVHVDPITLGHVQVQVDLIITSSSSSSIVSWSISVLIILSSCLSTQIKYESCSHIASCLWSQMAICSK